MRPLGVAIGDPAPSFLLADPAGRMVGLHDYAGRGVVVLFWTPECGYCRQMRHDLEEWDATSDRHERALLTILPGSPRSNGSLDVRSPVLTDPGDEVAAAYGVGRAPAAVLVDTDGRIASGPAVCAAAVLHLLYSDRYPTPPPSSCLPRV